MRANRFLKGKEPCSCHVVCGFFSFSFFQSICCWRRKRIYFAQNISILVLQNLGEYL